MAEHIDLYLISGFLGSGKTTLLKNMLDCYKGRKLGILVNEFGSISIDGAQLKKDGIQMIEINDGSVFCSCLMEDFVEALINFSGQPIDTLLIESSGLADPASMNSIITGLKPYVTRPYRYLGSVCLVDCTTFLDYADVLLSVQNQVVTSDLIIVNKTDLVDASALSEIHEAIRRLNQSAPIHDTVYARLPESVLEEKLINHGHSGVSTNTCDNRAYTYLLETDGVCEKEQLENFFAALENRPMRMKGFLKGTGGIWWQLEGVSNRLEITRTDPDKVALSGRGQVVFISDDERLKGQVENAWTDSRGGEMTFTST
jgi:G3E family GTPase